MAVAGTVAAALLLAGPALAEGTETLGPPGIAIATGSGIVAGGVGMQEHPNAPASFTVNVPAGATVKQVLLYWQGRFTSYLAAAGDDTISLNGHEVAGTRIGGPTPFFQHFVGPGEGSEIIDAYRADVTALGLVSAGANTLTVSSMAFASLFPNASSLVEGNHGAGVLVIYEEPGAAASIGVRDGLDLAYANFAPPLDTTVPQTFSFAASDAARTATLATFVGSVRGPDRDEHRPNQLAISFGLGGAGDVVIQDPWQSHQGPEFDVSTIAVTVPAGATQMTVQALSGGPGGLPASFAWSVAALAVLEQAPPPPPPPGEPARTIGFWKNWSSCSNGNQAPVLDQTLAAAGGITIGNLLVDACVPAVSILDKSTIDTGRKMASDPAYNLAAQLLAARLNFAAGAATCSAADAAANGAQALLAARSFVGTGAYAAGMTAAQRAQANALATTLDAYNNGTLC
jgi:hypothetical protein